MNKRSATIIAGGLVLALMAGIGSRELTLGSTPAAVRIVVQTPAPAPQVAASSTGELD